MSVRERLVEDIVAWKASSYPSRGVGEFDASAVRDELESKSLAEVKRRWQIVAENAWSMKQARRAEMDAGRFDGAFGDFIVYQLRVLERGNIPEYREYEDA